MSENRKWLSALTCVNRDSFEKETQPYQDEDTEIIRQIHFTYYIHYDDTIVTFAIELERINMQNTDDYVNLLSSSSDVSPRTKRFLLFYVPLGIVGRDTITSYCIVDLWKISGTILFAFELRTSVKLVVTFLYRKYIIHKFMFDIYKYILNYV